MTRIELCGRVRDVCAGILYRKGEVEAAHALFWQPAPILFRAATRFPAVRRRTRATMERQVELLLADLQRMSATKGGTR